MAGWRLMECDGLPLSMGELCRVLARFKDSKAKLEKHAKSEPAANKDSKTQVSVT